MTPLDPWADRILAAPLADARAASRAIAIVGFDIPEDLLAASGAATPHLPWSLGPIAPRVEAWIEGSFAPWTRSILQQWADGAFDFLESVIFSRGDDSAQRLYYYVSELQRRGTIGGPRALILDLARIPRPSSRTRTIAALRALAETLEIDEAGLRDGIAIANHRRAVFARLDTTRAGAGVRYERIARASLFASLPKDASGEALPREAGDASPRLLLAGTPPPDDRLHRVIEARGWTVVGEAHERGLGRLGPVIDPGGDPFAAVGAAAHLARFGPRSFADPAATLIAEARRVRADAVLLWLIEQEESIGWHVPAQRAALDQAGMPALVLTRRAWDMADDTSERIAAWLAELAR